MYVYVYVHVCVCVCVCMCMCVYVRENVWVCVDVFAQFCLFLLTSLPFTSQLAAATQQMTAYRDRYAQRMNGHTLNYVQKILIVLKVCIVLMGEGWVRDG